MTSVATSAKRVGVIFAIHLCRGNNQSQWYAEGGYDPIAEKLFNKLNVDTFLLEYDTERAGSFEPLRFVPRSKTIVLGLVSSKVAQLENVDDLMRKIDDAGRYVPLENLALSPQCGFASTMDGNRLTVVSFGKGAPEDRLNTEHREIIGRHILASRRFSFAAARRCSELDRPEREASCE